MKNVFGVWVWMMSFMMMFAVEGAGGAGGEDLGDFVIDEPETPAVETPTTPVSDAHAKVEVETPTEKPTEEKEKLSLADEMAVLRAENAELKASQEEVNTYVSQKQMEEAVTREVSKLTARYPDFDIEAVGAHLNEMAKDDEAGAKALNNPIGWENVFLNMQIDQGRGEFLPTRGVSKEPFDFEKSSKLAEAGNDKAKMDIFDNIK